MLIGQNVAILMFLGSVVLPKSSIEQKARDCIKGKQYWSESFLNPKGTCAPCPPHWKNCNKERSVDKTRCIKSCRGK